MLLSLPSELLLASLTYLPLEDLVKLRVVCKKLYSLCFYSYLLKALDPISVTGTRPYMYEKKSIDSMFQKLLSIDNCIYHSIH